MGESPGRILMVGGIVYSALAVLLAVGTPLAVADAAFLPVLLVLLPAVGVAQVPLASAQELPPKRLVYAASGVSTLFLGAVALGLGVRHGGPEAVGLRATSIVALAAWTVGLTALGLLLIILSRLLAGRSGIRESALLRYLLPENGSERGAFVLLAASAGFGEEVAFRGYAVPLLAHATSSLWAAIAISSVAFGIVHAYQGMLGVVRSGVLAALLALPMALAGNLWPAILAHAAVDIIAGVLLGRWLVGLGERV